MQSHTLLHILTLFTLRLLLASSAEAQQTNGMQCFAAPVDSTYSYCMHQPSSAGSQAQPLLIYLGGSGSKGSLQDAPAAATWSGAGYVLGQQLNGHTSTAGSMLENNFVVASVIAPTSTVHYNPDVIAGIYNTAVSNYNVDKTRVYIAGYSMGCRGVMRELVFHDSLYAAAICVSGYAEQSNSPYIQQQSVPATYPLLRNVIRTPIWFYASTGDTTNPMSLTQATLKKIQSYGGKCDKFSTMKGLSHSQMNYPAFENAGVYTWLLQHSQGQNAGACNQIGSSNNSKKPSQALQHKKSKKKKKH